MIAELAGSEAGDDEEGGNEYLSKIIRDRLQAIRAITLKAGS